MHNADKQYSVDVLFATTKHLLCITYAQISTNFSLLQNPFLKIELTVQVISDFAQIILK